MEDLLLRMETNPRHIFKIPEQPETWVEVDMDADWEIRAENNFSLCKWTPFEGRKVKGRVRKVVLRGREVFHDRHVLAQAGYGQNIKESKFY